jgi:chemotaxis protein histidine kinase CheA
VNEVDAPISSADLRAQIAAIEASFADLHDAVSRKALAAYAKPDDADARREADQALASLRDANDRLQQLNAAAELAERHEAAEAETLATAERQKAKDRLLRDRGRLQRLAEAEAEKGCDAYEALPAAEAKLGDLERQWRDQQVVVDVLLDRFHNASDHNLEYAEQVAALDAQIADFPVTAADVAAKEAAQWAARDAEAAERLADLTAETDRQLREIAAAHQLAYDSELVPVTPFRMAPGGWPPVGKPSRGKNPIIRAGPSIGWLLCRAETWTRSRSGFDRCPVRSATAFSATENQNRRKTSLFCTARRLTHLWSSQTLPCIQRAPLRPSTALEPGSPPGNRPAPLTLASTYPEKSPYGLPPAVLLAAIGAEIGVTICSANRYRSLRDRHRNPSLAPTAPKAGKFIWNPSSRQHERAPL